MKPLHALIVAIVLVTGLAIATYAATGDGADPQRPCTLKCLREIISEKPQAA